MDNVLAEWIKFSDMDLLLPQLNLAKIVAQDYCRQTRQF